MTHTNEHHTTRRLIGGSIAFILILFALAASAQVTFRGVTTLEAPDSPYELAQGDFNADGKPDLITANYTNAANQQVSVLLNSGSGTFAGTNFRNFPASQQLIDIAVGDFNEDGKLDAVACSAQNNNFSLLRGDGAGNLAAPQNIAAGDRPQGIAAGDMNKDNHLDVLIAHVGTPDDVYVYFGNGAGGFSSPLIVPITINLAYDVAVADFNGDTNPDFAVATLGLSASTVQIWNGDGLTNPTFTLAATVTGFGLNFEVDARDLDGDGDMDLLGAPGYAINDGTGSFGTVVGFVQSEEEYASGDLNHDGHPDIVATDYNGNQANTRVYLGDGAGAFALLAKFETGCFARGLEILDVNNDGNADLIGAGDRSSQGKIDILLGDGTGYFSNAVTKYPTLTDPRDMVKGDFNEDGEIDIALCHSTGVNNVTIYLGEGLGKFKRTAANFTAGIFPFQIITMDFNEDDHLDLITFNQSTSPTLTLFTGNGTGQFVQLPDVAVTNTLLGRIVATDYNSDTHPDLVVSGGTSTVINLFQGNGSGFDAPTTVSLSQGTYDVKAGDLTGDGKIDLAVRLYPASKFMILAGDGTGSFTEGIEYTVQRDLVELFDFNNDSKLDVILHSGGSFGNDILMNDGAGNFTATVFNGGLARSGLQYEDMNGDGNKDLLIGAQTSNSSEPGMLRIFKGTASGVFGLEIFNKMYSGGNKFVIHDVNGDDKPDIIATSFSVNEDYLAVLINSSGVAPCTAPAISSPPAIAACVGQNVTLSVTVTGTAPFTYQWRKGTVDLTGETASSLMLDNVTFLEAAGYFCTVTNACGSGTTSPITVTVTACSNEPPVIAMASLSTVIQGLVSIDLLDLISDADGDLDPNSLKIIESPESGAEATLVNGVLTIDYSGLAFSGTDHLTIEACDLTGNCVQREFTVVILGELIVYNGISPNGDGFNATWQILNIDVLPDTKDNTVTVYNRWGDEVYRAVNYDNKEKVFKGISAGGGELPSGTYYYRIEFDSGQATKMGYLVLVR